MIREMTRGLPPWGLFWAYLGLATLACAAGMSFAFGYEISVKHALFLVCLSIIAAFLPDVANEQRQQGRPITAAVLALISVPVLAIEFYTHAGYTAGLRGANIETATVQNARYDARQDEVREGKASLAMWEKRLADLTAEHAWAASVTAEALRAQLASANLAIEQESKRGGCGPRCLERTKERDALATRIALAEEKVDLTKKIEATKRILAGSREKAVTTEHKSSAVAHQNDFLARTVALVTAGSLEPSKIMSEGAQQTVNLAMAIAATGLPALAFFVMGLYRRHSTPEAEALAHAAPDRSVTVLDASPPVATPAPAKPTSIVILDETLRKWAQTKEARALA